MCFDLLNFVLSLVPFSALVLVLQHFTHKLNADFRTEDAYSCMKLIINLLNHLAERLSGDSSLSCES